MKIDNEKINDKIWYAGYGNTEGPILIVSSHPSFEDCKAGQLHYRSNNVEDYFSSDELFNAMKAAGLPEEKCFFNDGSLWSWE
jgi:hypothetical protein